MKDTSYLNAKRIRKEQKMSLKELSAQSGLSVSFLSNYENGKVNITVTSLHQIAEALGVSIKQLLATEQDDNVLVVRKDNRYAVVQNKAQRTVQEFLTRGMSFDMQVTVVHMPPHSNSGEPVAHGEGEEFIFVLQGSVELWMEDSEPVVLETGDMAYYSPQKKHNWVNTQDSKAEFLAVANKSGY